MVLEPSALDRLLRLLAARGVAVVEHWRPGLPPQRQTQLCAEAGLRLTDELRTWWSWRDGVDFRALTNPREGEFMASGWMPLTLETAIEIALERRRLALEIAGAHADELWNDSFLPIAGNIANVQLCCDTSVLAAAGTPVHYIGWPDFGQVARAALPSLGALLEHWAVAIETGRETYDPATRTWTRDKPLERIPDVLDAI